ncbi:hypothetical protein AB0J86_34170 [Micromonospora sp. NPDC049559]|uniref:hypothetical protein n=1 Tax=Micromonospora sp. NPDC049559 TaxID=3155923 RepID=UPI00343B138A
MTDRAPATSSEPRRRGTGHRLSPLVIPLLSTAFGAVSGVTIDAILPMTAFGLIWGIAAAAVAPRLTRWGERAPGRADLPLWLAVALAFVVLGAGLLGNILATTPQAQLDLLQRDAFGPFFYAIHGPFEWALMPLLVMVNWRRPGRRWPLVAAAVAFYAGRTASALYFAPHALSWAGDPMSADLDEVRRWTDLNWFRIVLQDTLTAVLLLLAATRSGPRALPVDHEVVAPAKAAN